MVFSQHSNTFKPKINKFLMIAQVNFTDQTKWYVGIYRAKDGRYESAVAYMQDYKMYLDLVKHSGAEIVVQEFGVNEEGVSRLTGHDKKNKRVGDEHLSGLIDRLNNGEERSAKEGLLKLCCELGVGFELIV